MGLPVIRPLALLEGRKIRKEGDLLAVTPPLGPERREALRPLKPGLLAALEDGEVLAGEELLGNPFRLAALLLALFPPPEGLLAVAIFRPGRVEHVLAPNPLPALRWCARTAPPPKRLHLGHPLGRWTLDLRPPVQTLLVARGAVGLEVLAYSEEDMRRYLEAAAEAKVAAQEAFLETPGRLYTGPAWAALKAALGQPKGVVA